MCRKITVIAIRIPNRTKPPTTVHTTMMISLVLSGEFYSFFCVKYEIRICLYSNKEIKLTRHNIVNVQ